MSTQRPRGREKPVVGIAATRCNISTFVFVICPMLDSIGIAELRE